MMRQELMIMCLVVLRTSGKQALLESHRSEAVPRKTSGAEEFVGSTRGLAGVLAQPLTAQVATAGPTIRPTSYLWEDGAFWILSGPVGKLVDRVGEDPRLALSVDVCEVAAGLVRPVVATGAGEIVPTTPSVTVASCPAPSATTSRSGTPAFATTCTATRRAALSGFGYGLIVSARAI